MAISEAAFSAAAEDEIAAIGHILEDSSARRVADQRARGDLDCNVGSVLSVALAAGARSAVLGYEFSLVSEREQGV